MGIKIEAESKVINIDHERIVNRLNAIGAECIGAVVIEDFRFIVPGRGRPVMTRFGRTPLRLRSDTEVTVISKTRIPSQNHHVRINKELTTQISSREECEEELKALGLIIDPLDGRTIKHRTTFILPRNKHGSMVLIDFDNYRENHSFIPPFMEIEDGSVKSVIDAAKRLGIPRKDLKSWGRRRLFGHFR